MNQIISIKNDIKKFKPNRQNVKVTKHFRKKLHQHRGLSPNIADNISEYVRGVFRKLETTNVIIQNFKGRKRIIINTRGLYLVVSYSSFIRERKLVLISLLNNKMDLGGSIKKPKRKVKKDRKNNHVRVSYELLERVGIWAI